MNPSPICPVSRLDSVLLATDRSEFSKGAILEAIDFAKRCNSKLYVVSVLETNPEYETIGSKFFEKEEAEVASHLASIKANAAAEGLNCEIIFHQGGEPCRHILDEATKKNVNMIIVGRRGHKGLGKLLVGSVAAKVIGYAACNVLVVPKESRIGYQKVLVASDGSEHGNAAVAQAISIAGRCGSSLVVLSSVRTANEIQEAQFITESAVKMAQSQGVQAEAVTPIGRSYETIVETAGGRGVDLIVMGAYGKSGLVRILMGSATERVIALAGCSVLVVTT
ncbi:MAG: universal stress protein [Nitrospirae bacterium]|nr:universal stress protein [Nitrospirota bacterium]